MLARQFGTGTIYKHLAATLQEALWGLGLGFLAGAALAWLATRSEMIADLLDVLSHKGIEADEATEAAVRDKVKRLVGRFPIYET